jgi:hypothetical protein
MFHTHTKQKVELYFRGIYTQSTALNLNIKIRQPVILSPEDEERPKYQNIECFICTSDNEKRAMSNTIAV